MMETATRTPTKPDVRLIDELGEVGGEVSRLRGVGVGVGFDLEFMAAQLGLAGHKAYDTQIAEQVILGMGWSSAYDHKIPLDLAAIGAKYGVEVHKEERSWFIRLDERDEWWLPFPDEQVQYMRSEERRVGKECRSRWSPYH